MNSTTRNRALRRELAVSEHIPYAAHVAREVIRTTSGDYLQVFRLEGVGFEAAEDSDLDAWQRRLNVLWRNVASPSLAMWVHVVRRRVRSSTGPVADGAGFEDRLHARYSQRLAGATLMNNELYLSLVYRPSAGAASGLLARVLGRGGAGERTDDLSDSLESCAKLARVIEASLAPYAPQRLGTYCHRGRTCSSMLEFLAMLVNGEWQRMAVPEGPIDSMLGTSRLFFGNEAIEYRPPTGIRVGAFLGIKEYPTPTAVGMYDGLLSVPFAFVLTQSFTFLSRAAGQSLLQRQYHRMANAGDFAVSQAQELKTALDGLSSNEFVMGDHHLTLQVICDAEEVRPDEPAFRRLQALNDHVALARSMLANTGMTVAREDIALESAFWAQLPGNFAFRTRKAPITSRNFSAMAGFHNFPSGRATGNHWGDALAVLASRARSPYHFSLHASDPHEPDGGSRRDTGHTLMCGPTGSGKTVLIGFLIAMLARRGATQVVFDKDRGLEILVRAVRGEYLPLSNGVPTGFNPLQLTPSPENFEFQKGWLHELVRPATGAMLSATEELDIDQALHGTLSLEAGARRLSRLIEFLDRTRPDGLHARLSPWCAATGGDYAWVFDAGDDTVVPQLSGRPLVGFDVTDFLSNRTIRTPVTLYLFHLVRRMLDGRRLVCWMDEFWRLLDDPAFVAFAKDGPKTWRKHNGVMCLATQSASDVLASPIARTLVEQTATKVFFPSPEGSAEEYLEGLGLTRREFQIVREGIEPGSRRFLVKQGRQSVVCELDLKGFDAELAVISGRAAGNSRMRQLIDAHGADPDRWLPAFLDSYKPVGS